MNQNEGRRWKTGEKRKKKSEGVNFFWGAGQLNGSVFLKPNRIKTIFCFV